MKLPKNAKAISLLLILVTCATVVVLRAQDTNTPPSDQSSIVEDLKPQTQPTLTNDQPEQSLPDSGGLDNAVTNTTSPLDDSEIPMSSMNLVESPKPQPGTLDTFSPRIYPDEEINQMIANAEAQAKVDRNGEREPTEPTAELHLLSDEPYNEVKTLIQAIKQLGINRIILSRVRPGDANPFPVMIVCHPDVSWRRVREIEAFMRTHTKYKVEVRVRGPGPMTSTQAPPPEVGTPVVPNITPTQQWFIPDTTAPKVKVRFAGLAGAAIGWENKQQRWANNQLTIPATYEFAVGNTYRIKAQFAPDSSAALYTLLHVFPDAANYPNTPIVFEINRLMTHALQNGNFRQVIYVENGYRSPEQKFKMTDYQHGVPTNLAIERIEGKGHVLAVISVGRYDATNLYWASPANSDNSPMAIGPHDLGLMPKDTNAMLFPYDYSPQPYAPTTSSTEQGILPTQLPVEALQPNVGNNSQPEQNQIDFRKQQQELDQQSLQIAARLRQPQLDATTAHSLRFQLLDTVSKSFAARQSMLKQELNKLGTRLDALKESIDNRDTHGKQIIERRVEELLDPNLNWQPAEALQESTTTAARN